MRQPLGLVAALGGMLLAATLTPTPAAADPIKLALNIWVGFGPLYIARDKGFFQKRGLDVDLIVMENVTEKYGAFASGEIDMAAGGAGTSVLYLDEPDQFQYVAATDDSNGGDGIVAKTEITSLVDLRGKSVAVLLGSISEQYLAVLLKTAGLKENDLKIIDMRADDAGKAFINKEVDAAVTWEPWLSKAKATEFGHLLIDSSVTPGVLCDVLVARKDFVANHPKDVKGVVDAWNEAVAYFDSHRQESIELMAKAMGDWLKDPKVFAETLDGVRYYGAADNKVFFGTKAKPGPLYESVKEAIAVWSDLGKVRVKVAPENIINYSFVNN
jgi:NitT/TauT family transport system substrate-binding protein